MPVLLTFKRIKHIGKEVEPCTLSLMNVSSLKLSDIEEELRIGIGTIRLWLDPMGKIKIPESDLVGRVSEAIKMDWNEGAMEDVLGFKKGWNFFEDTITNKELVFYASGEEHMAAKHISQESTKFTYPPKKRSQGGSEAGQGDEAKKRQDNLVSKDIERQVRECMNELLARDEETGKYVLQGSEAFYKAGAAECVYRVYELYKKNNLNFSYNQVWSRIRK